MIASMICIYLLLFLILASLPVSSSFTVSIIESRTGISRSATIYEWDDDNKKAKSSFDQTKILDEDYDEDIYSTITDHLSHDTEKTASLARLAVAFSPPEQRVNLEDINHIHIIEVANDHIEISAVVCDEKDCITLLVPVTFPHECGSSGVVSDSDMTEECVLDNIFELDVEAQEVLRQRRIEKQQETSDQEKELLSALHSNDDIKLPSWWIPPVNADMVEECQKIKRILNQDGFQSQVKSLAIDGLAYCDEGEAFKIQKAAVCNIGPSGFYFRAIATKLMNNEEYTILEIPYNIFNNEEISETSQLRAAVLGAVASVE